MPCIRLPELAPLHTFTLKMATAVFAEMLVNTFDVAYTRKPKLYSEFKGLFYCYLLLGNIFLPSN
jgi:hypothetical protein